MDVGFIAAHKMITDSIHHIIFDLGGVIISLDVEATIQQFAQLSGKDPDAVRSLMKTHEFKQYEEGRISDAEFRDAVRHYLQVNADDLEIDTGWNAMLGEISMERLELLAELKSRYSLYLLSNTNHIHFLKFNQIVQDLTGHQSLAPYFDKTYYSHHVNLSKPDRRIFELVLHENNLESNATLFLDDNWDNLKGADEVGIQTVHVPYPDMILSLLR